MGQERREVFATRGRRGWRGSGLGCRQGVTARWKSAWVGSPPHWEVLSVFGAAHPDPDALSTQRIHRGSWALEQKTQITAPQTHNLHQKGRYFIAQMLLYHSLSDLNINYTLNSIDTIPQNTNETIVVVKYIAITMSIKYVFPSRKRWKLSMGQNKKLKSRWFFFGLN